MPRRNRRFGSRDSDPREQRRAERRDRGYVEFIAGRDADDDIDTDFDLDAEDGGQWSV
jgi:hypothetical protein